jgi:Rrf2 family protein
VLKISRKVEYALMALKYMSDRPNDERTSARELCQYFKIPFDTIAKVMQVMNSGQLLKSVQGVKGGYTLNGDLGQTSFLTLHLMLEGDGKGNSCLTSSGKCALQGNCNIISPLERVQGRVNQYLDNLTLKELLSDQ